MGPLSPRDFDPGFYQQVDMNLNADFTYSVSETFNMAFGAEYRTEEFTVGTGQEESYTDGGLGEQGFSTSSNGFPGFPAKTSGEFERTNYAAYVESEWDASDNLLIQSALRFEDFDDFGTTTNYKLGANLKLSDDVGLRATYSTGFKAPTPGQSNTSNTSTELSAGVLVNNGTIPATSAVALRNGGKPLEPEDATNLTLGAYMAIGEFDITVDFFDIDVENRLNLSTEVELTDADIADLIAEGVPGAGDLRRFRFFTNDFDTSTKGFDIVVSRSMDMFNGTTDFNLAYNFTKTEVTDYNADTIDAQRIKQIEDTTPETRWNLSANHMVDDWRVLARVSFYDEWFDQFECDVFSSGCNDEITANPDAYVFNSEFIVDLEVQYNFNENSSILIGGNNVFDNSGQTTTEMHNIIGGDGFLLNTATAAVGNKYSTFAPMGFSGAYWYAKYKYDF